MTPCMFVLVLEGAALVVSPDGSLRARISTDDHGESRVRIEEALSGRVLLARDDTSPDGGHGYACVRGAWTPDSNFFVAGLASSGGHQPWAHPVWIYSRAANRVVELWSVGITPTEPYRLRSPDILVTRAGARRISVSLGELLCARRRIACPAPQRKGR